jgi:C1A family cysteine protease
LNSPSVRRSCPCRIPVLVILLLCLAFTVDAATVNRQIPVAATTTAAPVLVQRVLVTTTPTPAPTVTCQAPCECLERSAAVAKWGDAGFTQCAELPCAHGMEVTGAPVEKYCFQPKVTPTLTVLSRVSFIPVSTTTPQVLQTVSCPAGQKLCASTGCANTSTDIKNCGSCGHTCSFGLECSDGVCRQPIAVVQKPAGTCYMGMTSCNGVCTDMQTDPLNCGACGDQCSPGEPCTGGSCGIACPQGRTQCRPGECLDLQNDPENCGACGASCGLRETCSQGKCYSLCGASLTSFTSFSWADWRGTNWLTSVKNQGACGSCWAESVTGVTEGTYNLEQGSQKNLDLSEQAFVSGCNGDFGSCTGGDHTAVLKSMKSSGIPDDSVLPYQSGACAHTDANGYTVCNAGIGPHCSTPNSCDLGALAPDRLWKIQSYQKETASYPWTASDEFTTIRKAILCKGPLDVCSGHWWHCVTLVGWQGSEYSANSGWIIKNSWGGNGYQVIPYGDPWSTDKNDYGDLVLDAWSVKGVYHAP